MGPAVVKHLQIPRYYNELGNHALRVGLTPGHGCGGPAPDHERGEGQQFGLTRNNHELSHRALAEYQHLATDVDRDQHWTKYVEKDRNEHRI